MKVIEETRKRGYETREDVGPIRRYIRRKLSWSNVRQPLAILIAIFIWHLLTTFDAPLFEQVSSPLEVIRDAIIFIPTKAFAENFMISNFRVGIGFMMAIVTGIPLGLGMGYKRVFNELTFPTFEILRPIPPIAWLPLSTVMFPTTEMSVIYLVYIGAFFPIVLNTYLGVVTIGENYRWAALSLGASPKDIFRHIILPGATPATFTGMQIGAGMTWEMVVAAEMIAGGSGLGYMTWDAFISLAFSRIILGMVCIGFSGYVLSGLVRFAGVKYMPWRQLF